MKKRVITGTVYALIIVACILLKAFFPEYGPLAFDALFTAVSVIGAYEFLRAAKMRSALQFAIALIFCILVVPFYVIIKYFDLISGQYAVIALFGMAIFAVFIAFVFDNEHAAFSDTSKAIICMLYVGFMSVLLSSCNHMQYNSLATIILVFASTTLTDTVAFLTGSVLGKKFPKKIAPSLSPNKTVVGCLGGLVGGALGALLAYGLFLLFGGEYYCTFELPAIWAFIIIGFIASVFGQIGDLFESAVKRAFGVKDMGNLLPGHGGVLDRFDSTLFAGVAVYACFWLLTVF